MARPKRILSAQLPYHITARCINKEWFKLPIEEVWTIFADRLYFCSHAFNLRIHAFVLMNNHFHLLVTTPDANISDFMMYFLSEVSREITQRAGRINQTFGGPYYGCLIRTDLHFLHAYKYVYRNPVEAGLTQYVADYPFSTLHSLIGRSKCPIPLSPDYTLFESIESTLTWLDTGYKDNGKEAIRLALRKPEFKLARCPVTRKKNIYENELS